MPARVAPALAPAPRPTVDVDAARAAQWRARKLRAEREKAELTRHAGSYRQVVTWCNRGAAIRSSRDAPLPPGYDCDSAREEYAQLRERLVELESYLDRGLADECRRAGCLPGWIR